ncbi:MAG TPA: gamma-glutamyltransferase [Gammaproteobacteria bacterium]|nr:gamma-glutamyltransferase [Gammaproteobacteria bacterium]|tara:strand:+ start:3834 stop:5492 length:1659 start_codon:yes stop_codon:yes gene_type:complete
MQMAVAALGSVPAPPQAAIASAHPAATSAGREILEAGGNAFDAAIAVAAALAVVEPYSSGIGGGGFFLLHRAADGHETMIDAREKAPAAATVDMYLDERGEFVRERSLNGPLSSAIPGTPAGLVHLADHYGRLSLKESLEPAIRLATNGFIVKARYHRMARFRQSAMVVYPSTAAIFLGDDNHAELGEVIKQPDLANTLRLLAEQGTAGFYRGEIGYRLIAGVRAHGGIWTQKDLNDYEVVEREPVIINYGGIRIVTAPPPSSGGVAMAEAFNILSQFDLGAMTPNTRRHIVIEAMRRAYRDRAEYLGDPDHVEIPLAQLLSVDYAKFLAGDISIDHATPSEALRPIGVSKGEDTTHFSVLDTQGNRVAATLSVNYPFGAVFVPDGTGVLLNNEMDDFSARPMTPNAYGLVGVDANAIAPGKRPLSSMTPTFLETGNRVGILGTPGGSRIISMVMIGILDFASGNKPESWVRAKRYHHQYLPDEVQFELGGLTKDEQLDLRQRGHRLRENNRNYGNMHAILWRQSKGEVSAASDPRGEGSADVFDVSIAHQR